MSHTSQTEHHNSPPQGVAPGAGLLLNYSDHPDGRFDFLAGTAEIVGVAARIGRHKPDEHARRLISCVIDDFLLLVEALYEEGWEDLLARLQIAFEIKGQPLNALRERNHGRVPDFPDLLGQLDDPATVPSPGLAGPHTSSEIHPDTVGHQDLPSGVMTQ